MGYITREDSERLEMSNDQYNPRAECREVHSRDNAEEVSSRTSQATTPVRMVTQS